MKTSARTSDTNARTSDTNARTIETIARSIEVQVLVFIQHMVYRMAPARDPKLHFERECGESSGRGMRRDISGTGSLGGHPASVGIDGQSTKQWKSLSGRVRYVALILVPTCA